MAKERFDEIIDRVPVVNKLKSNLIQRILRQELTREIKRCLAYFQEQPSIGKQGEVTTVKGSRIRVGKREDGALFFEETVFWQEGIRTPYREIITIKGDSAFKERFSLADGNPIPFPQRPIRKQERQEIIYKIQNITPGFAQHLKEAEKPT